MGIKIGSDSVGNIYVGSTKIGKVYLGNNLVYPSTPPVSDDVRFNYIGIDANENEDTSSSYNFQPVAYAIGGANYSYGNYELVSPTPTTKADYGGKYVASGDTYTLCSYDSTEDVLTPEGIEVGVTPCYTRTPVNRSDRIPDTATLKFSSASSLGEGNGFSRDYWGTGIYGIYSDPSSIPVIPELEEIVFPDTYQGKPVTTIKSGAFQGYYKRSQGGSEYYLAYQIKRITLGANTKTLEGSSLAMTCRVPEDPTTRSFTFNNKLVSLASQSLRNVLADPNSFNNLASIARLPNTVTSINPQAFSLLYGVESGTVVGRMNKIIISTPNISLGALSSYGVGDYTKYLVFENGVGVISGTLVGMTTGHSIVFKHAQDQIPTLILSKNKNAIAVDVYTDCNTIRGYDWAAQNYTVTFHPLSDYEGD